MGRRKGDITNLFTRDQEALTMLARTGHCTIEQLKHAGIVENRAKSYLAAKLVEKDYFRDPENNLVTVYKLTNKGKNLVSDKYNVKFFYKSNSPRHDSSLADKYIKLTKEERATWKTETELQNEFKQKMAEHSYNGREAEKNRMEDMLQNKTVSAPDACYTHFTEQGASTICVEVITPNYGCAEIESKENFAGALGFTIEFIKNY